MSSSTGTNNLPISKLYAREILDSRGNPTVEVEVFANTWGRERIISRSNAPSGASTGINEAHELRDGDPKRYLGRGVLTAVKNVNTKLNDALKGQPLTSLRHLDNIIIKADGDQLKKNIGGNATTATSFALADAIAFAKDIELFLVFADEFHNGKRPGKFHLPRPMVNIINGGKHAGGDLQVQEFMIVPKANVPVREMIRIASEVFHHLGKILVKKIGVSAKNVGDEGGYAPLLSKPDEALSLIEEAIQAAGYKANEDVFLALDPASSEFYKNGKYEVEKGLSLSSAEMVQYYADLIGRHPSIISLEDPLAEEDYEGWKVLSSRFSKEFPHVMIVGDDIYTTNTNLIQKGIQDKWAKDLLLKVNQIGTISEAMDAAKLILDNGGNVVVSHRSGEVTNTIISDLVVGIGAKFIKTGSMSRGERLCKYNRLIAIEEYLEQHNLL